MNRLASSLVVVLLLAACGGAGNRVIVAAGTTLVDSGFVDEVVAAYETSHPDAHVSVIGESTAQVLELGRSGGADVLMVHAPRLEEAFVEAGEADSRQPLFASRFLLVGPAEEVGRYAGRPAAEVMRSLAAAQERFVSRSDGSGTHEVERELWAEAGVVPDGQDWYVETGQGMGLTLQVADQQDAFTLAELGAYLAAQATLDLLPVETSDTLENPYSIIVVRDAPPAALDLAAWLVSADGSTAIEEVNQALFGQVVYQPATEQPVPGTARSARDDQPPNP